MNANHQKTKRLWVAVATLIVIPIVISLSAGLGLVSAGLQVTERWTREGGPIETMEAVLYFLAFLGCLVGWGKEARKGNFWRTPWLFATIIAFAIFAKEMEWENLIVPSPPDVPFFSVRVLHLPLLSLPHRLALIGLWLLLAYSSVKLVLLGLPKVKKGLRRGDTWAVSLVAFVCLLFLGQVADKSKVWLPFLMGEQVRQGALNEVRRIVSQSFEECFELTASAMLCLSVMLSVMLKVKNQKMRKGKATISYHDRLPPKGAVVQKVT